MLLLATPDDRWTNIVGVACFAVCQHVDFSHGHALVQEVHQLKYEAALQLRGKSFVLECYSYKGNF